MFIGGQRSDAISNQRLKGFTRKMLNQKIHVPKERIIYTDSTRKGAYKAIMKLFNPDSTSKKTVPEAIVCENNFIALGVVKALKELNYSIPDDIAFLTFDRYPYSDIIDPKPTVIDINVFDIGLQAGNMMIRKLDNPDLLVQSFTTLPVVIKGDSTVVK